MMSGHLISKVEPGSIAEELEIEAGDRLLSINGKEVRDVLDFLFYSGDDELEIEIMKPSGEVWALEIEKEYYEEIGIEFGNPILDDAKRCHNQCVFCFIDQLPPGMRPSLYFKDDDSRLSFLQGNYVTLTNVKESDLDRMIEYQLSPVNVSIHTTNPILREKMLCNRFAGNIFARLKKLTDHKIEVNGQIVLVPGINDGDELDRTLRDLSTLGSSLVSIAAVPVGVTRFRTGLVPLALYNKVTASRVIDQVEHWQKTLLVSRGSRFIHLSDEFYLTAQRPVPEYDAYEGFRQIENGVGLIRKFDTEVRTALQSVPAKTQGTHRKKRSVDIVTGTLAAGFMNRLAEEIMAVMSDLEIRIHPVVNHFFGETITVAGLVTGTDLYETLKRVDSLEWVLMPEAMLKSEETVMLDDWTVEMLEEKLSAKFYPVKVEGHAFIETLLKLISETSGDPDDQENQE
jgi:putative radical SAM enzyme (TIGR03279 family)